MDYTESQLSSFKSEFARRKRNQLIAASPIIAAMIGFVLFESELQEALSGVPQWAAISSGVALVGSLLLFSWRTWRCPACDKYFGKSTSMAHCPSCGVVLK